VFFRPLGALVIRHLGSRKIGKTLKFLKKTWGAVLGFLGRKSPIFDRKSASFGKSFRLAEKHEKKRT